MPEEAGVWKYGQRVEVRVAPQLELRQADVLLTCAYLRTCLLTHLRTRPELEQADESVPTLPYPPWPTLPSPPPPHVCSSRPASLQLLIIVPTRVAACVAAVGP